MEIEKNNNEELNHMYSCSQWAGYKPELVLENFIVGEERAYAYMKAVYPVEEDVPYGLGERQKIDIWGTVKDKLFIFFHGGYWQEGDRKYCLSPACHLTKHMAVALVGYELACEKRSLAKTVQDAIDGTKFLIERYPDVNEIIIGGHSAGAHLAYQVAIRLQDPKIKKLILLSAVLQLHELALCEIGQKIGLSEEDALKYSCNAYDLYDKDVKMLVISALKDAPKLIEQNRILYSSLKTIRYPKFHELISCDHFNLISRFQDEESEQSKLLFRFLELLAEEE